MGQRWKYRHGELCGIQTLAHAHGKIWYGGLVCSCMDLSELAYPYPPFIIQVFRSTYCGSGRLSVVVVGSRLFVRSVQYMVRHRSNCLRQGFLFCWSSLENVNFRPARSTAGIKTKIIGRHAELRAVDGEISEALVKNVSFKWKPGQRIYLRLPTIGLSNHILSQSQNNCDRSLSTFSNDTHLVIQKWSGFTRRLHRKAITTVDGRTIG